MFRIRRIPDDTLLINRMAIAQVQELLRSRFPLASEGAVSRLPEQLTNPIEYGFRTVLFVADDLRGHVKGFAILLHLPDPGFCYLDYICTHQQRLGNAVGSALYERVRQEALAQNAVGLFYECLPDDARLCSDRGLVRENAARLRFYERYGARPIANTAYETPLRPGGECAPYLVYDDLGHGTPLPREVARRIVRAILARRYRNPYPPGYVEMVVGSFQDDPVRLRAFRYAKAEPLAPANPTRPVGERIALVVNDQQAVHHVHERGYVEGPARVDAILHQLQRLDLFEQVPVRHFADSHIRAVHDGEFVEYLKHLCENLEPGTLVYPYIFPIRNPRHRPKDPELLAGYYCIDTFTPLSRQAYLAARRAVDCALTAAEEILAGRRLAYALVRPPGHHAERRFFGGFCYLNSTAIAAHHLSRQGRVAVLDVDYHHGNGTQDIFYERSDVLTISIHGHPRIAYPYFSGYACENGAGAGEGYNLNLPLPEAVDGEAYRRALERALKRVVRHKPQFLVVALGLDTARHDPTGSWSLQAADFRANGQMIGALGLPTLVVQEGGYYIRSLGTHARQFLEGLWKGVAMARQEVRPKAGSTSPGGAQSPGPRDL